MVVNRPQAAARSDAARLEVSEIETLVLRCIEKHFEGRLQVKGEVSDVRCHGGERPWFSFDLVEMQSRHSASIHAFIGAKELAEIERRLAPEGATVQDLVVDGHEIVVSAGVRYDCRFHRVELGIDSIDPEWTLGWLARTTCETWKRLSSEGLHLRQPALDLPVAPVRIALVSGEASQGLGDARGVLERSGFAVSVEAYLTRLEGNGAAGAVSDMIERAGSSENDVVLVVRGGRSQFSLWPFNSDKVARAIAVARKPVITGIGHESNETLSDLVAHRSLSTPTAAANEVVRRLEHTETRVPGLEREVREKVESGFRSAKAALDKARGAAERATDEAVRGAERRAGRVRRNWRRAGAVVVIASAVLALLVSPVPGGGLALIALAIALAARRRVSIRKREARRHQQPMDAAQDLTYEQALVRLEEIPRRLAATSSRDPEAIARLALEASQLVTRCETILRRCRSLDTGVLTAAGGGMTDWNADSATTESIEQ